MRGADICMLVLLSAAANGLGMVTMIPLRSTASSRETWQYIVLRLVHNKATSLQDCMHMLQMQNQSLI